MTFQRPHGLSLGGGLSTGSGLSRSGGSIQAPRSFTVSPAVSGKTTWNLDTDGPCTFTPGTYTITPLPGFSAVVEIWGPGGGAGGIGATTATNGVSPNPSTFTTGGVTMSAGNGVRTVARVNNTAGPGGAGGTASGGDVNTTGSTGGTASTAAATAVGGDGAAGGAPGGGTTVTGPSATAGNSAQGGNGNAPGGGGAGSAHGDATAANRRASGGGGGGAYCKRTFAVGVLTPGVARTLTIRTGGAGGTGDYVSGGSGADSKAVFT